jgi:hypothetical protein
MGVFRGVSAGRRGRNNERTGLALVLLAVALLGCLLLVGSLLGEQGVLFPWRDLLKEFGIALLVAAVVGFAVERYLRESLYQDLSGEIRDNLAAHREEAIRAFYFRDALPQEISDVVRRTVVEYPFVERDLTFHVEMTVVNAGEADGEVRSVIVTSYEVENLSHEDKEFVIEDFTGFDQRLEAGYKRVGMTGCSDNFAQNWMLDGANVRPFISYTRGYEYFSRKVVLPGRARMRVELEEVSFARPTDYYVLFAMRPTIGLEVTLRAPVGVLAFEGEPSYSLEDVFVSNVDDASGQHSWRIAGGLLPGTGIRVDWAPLEAERGAGPKGDDSLIESSSVAIE